MSGGVDSAVALLRAGPNAVGVTLRLWLDPEGPGSERACCSPDAVIAARQTCHCARAAARDARPARGVPARGRRAVHPRLRARRDPESVHPLQRHASASPSCSRSRAAIGAVEARDGPLRADRLAPRPPAARAGRVRREGPVVHARRASTRRGSSASGSRSATRARTRRGPRRRRPGSPSRRAPRARRRASSRATTTATSSSGTAPRRAPARSSTRRATSSVGTRARGASRPGSARASASRPAVRSTCCAPSRAPNAVVVGPREALARRRVSARGRLYVPVERAEAKLRYRSPGVPARVLAGRARLPAGARRARVRRRRRAGRCSLRGRRRRRVWPGDLRPRRIRSWRDARDDLHLERPRVSRAERLPPRARARRGLRALAARRHVQAALVADRRHRARGAARHREGRRHGRPRQRRARQGRRDDRQRRRRRRQRRHGRARGELGGDEAGAEGERARHGPELRRLDAREAARLAQRGAGRQGSRRAARAGAGRRAPPQRVGAAQAGARARAAARAGP